MRTWDPFEEMRRMHEDMDKLFSYMHGSPSLLPAKLGEGSGIARLPVVGLKETDADLIATVEIPGASKDSIDLNVTERSLEIKADQKHVEEEKSERFHGKKITTQSFYRKMSLPVEVKVDQAKASYEDGILRVVMPKAVEKSATKKIDIK